MSAIGVVDAPPRLGRSTPWTVALLGTAILLAVVLLAAVGHQGRADWFVGFGVQGDYTPYAREVLGREPVVSLADGHDGQASWVQARDPLLLDAEVGRAVIDRPVYRAQRMLYPTLASPFRLAGEEALLWGLVLVNLAVVAFGTYVTARLAVDRGAPPVLGLAFALSPVAFVALALDLGDALAMGLLIATVLALRERRVRLALLLAVAAVLAKELTLLSLGSVALLWTEGGPLRRRLPLVVVPALVAASWALYVRVRFDFAPDSVGELTIVPLHGFQEGYRVEWHALVGWHNAAVALVLLGLSVVIVVRWVQRRSLELTAALPLAFLVPFLSYGVLARWTNSVRVLGPAVILLLIDWYATSDRSTAMADEDARPGAPVAATVPQAVPVP